MWIKWIMSEPADHDELVESAHFPAECTAMGFGGFGVPSPLPWHSEILQMGWVQSVLNNEGIQLWNIHDGVTYTGVEE